MKLNKILLILALISLLPSSCKIGEGDLDDDDDFDFNFDEDGGALLDGGGSGGAGGKTSGKGGSTAGGGGKTSATAGKGGAAGKSASAGSGGSAGTAGKSDASTAADSGQESGTLPTVEDVPDLMAKAVCAARVKCQGAALLLYDLEGQQCEGRTSEVFTNRDFVYLQDSVDTGRVEFEPAKLNQCLTDITAQECDVQTSRRPASCKAALVGKVALGSRCAIDEECEGAAFCDRGSDWSTCPGTCTDLISEGVSGCRVSNHCKDGLVCSAGKCIKLVPKYEYCSSSTAPCQIGQECFQALCTPQSEVYSVAEGAACDPEANQMCKLNDTEQLSCVLQDSNAMICQKQVEAGAACRKAQPSQCPYGQYCNVASGNEGTCANLPSENEPCRSSQSFRCAPGLLCSDEDSRCYPINPNGSACGNNTECFSGICGSKDQCEAPPACDLSA